MLFVVILVVAAIVAYFAVKGFKNKKATHKVEEKIEPIVEVIKEEVKKAPKKKAAAPKTSSTKKQK